MVLEDGLDGWHRIHGIPKAQLLDQVLASNADPVLVAEPQSRRIIAFNAAFQRLFGYPSEQLRGRTTEVLYPDLESCRRADRLARHRLHHAGAVHGELLMRTGDGRIITTCHAVRPIIDTEGHIAATISIIRPTERTEPGAIQGARDPMTNLPDRQLFRRLLEGRMAASPGADPLAAVVALNLDRFRYVNNALGIGAGDQLLAEVAARLEAVVRPPGTVARTGSDDFMVLLTHSMIPEGIQPLLRRLLHQLRRPFLIGQEVLHLSGCLGIARYPADAIDAEGLMVCADTALQRARFRGPGNLAFYEADMTDSVVTTAALESDLHCALERGEIEVHYQPKVDPLNFQVLGLEALARWQHPVRGSISPAQFIPLAEETGLIRAIGEQVLYTACAQSAEWARRGVFHGPVSINVSGREMTESTGHRVRSILHETGLPAERLELEITESALIADTDQAQRLLSALTEAGISIALDDFGKGYSALSYLRRFPVRTLKIDRSFVERIQDAPSQSDLVGAIVAMARTLGMSVVAEGVETAAELEVLRRHGVDAIQGWYFSPALAPEDMELLLARGPIQPTGTAS